MVGKIGQNVYQAVPAYSVCRKDQQKFPGAIRIEE